MGQWQVGSVERSKTTERVKRFETENRVMRTPFKMIVDRFPYFVLGGALLVAAATAAVTEKGNSKDEPKTTPIKLAVDERPVTREGKFGLSFAPVVKKVVPS